MIAFHRLSILAVFILSQLFYDTVKMLTIYLDLLVLHVKYLLCIR